MKSHLQPLRLMLAVLTASLPLALGVGTAQAHEGGGGFPGFGGGQTVLVTGTIVSVDTANNSFVANAYIAGEPRGAPPPGPPDDQNGTGQDDQGAQSGPGGPGGDQGSGGKPGGEGHHNLGPGSGTQPTATQVTITTDPNSTKFRVNGKDGSITDLAAGQRFYAGFKGDSSEDITTLVTHNPAIGVMAVTPPKPNQLYAFVGTVTGVDTTNGTVTVNVTNSLPSGLVPAASNPATFTIGGDTLILGGTSTSGLSWGSLGNVSVGDVVAGGLLAPAGETLAQVEATQLRLLLDFPAGSHTHAAQTQTRALAQAKALLGYKAAKKHKKKHKPTKKHH